MTTIDKAALLAKVKATGEDQTRIEEFKGGEPDLVEGLHNARFIAYIEVGKHAATFNGKPKKNPDELVYLGFEFSGPKVVPRGDGQPTVKFIKLNKSFGDKAGFPKIMAKMNYKQTATHMAELLGEPYQIMVNHSKKTGTDGKERTYVNLRKKGEPHDIRAPRYEVQDENGPTGVFKEINVAPAVSPEMIFLWDHADMAQWGSIFIDGEFAEKKNEAGEVTHKAKSKNFYQALIKSAKNFQGSPIHQLLVANGANLDIPDAEAPGQEEDDDGQDETTKVGTKAPVDTPTPTGQAADDALSSVVG